MSTQSPAADPVALIDGLDADAIAARLDQLGRQTKALRLLLRAARARQQAQKRAQPTPNTATEVAHAH
jgi:hypothetical protein